MKYNEFVGEVQHRLELPEQGKTVRAIRAVLQTLGERLQAGEAKDLASPLPMEIDYYLYSADSGQRFDYSEFNDRVSERANVDKGEATYYGKVVVALVSELVPGSEMNQVRAQLPPDYEDLFEIADAENE